MPELEILTVDDPQQHAVLRSKSKKVQKVTPKLAAFAKRMLETMRAAMGADPCTAISRAAAGRTETDGLDEDAVQKLRDLGYVE